MKQSKPLHRNQNAPICGKNRAVEVGKVILTDRNGAHYMATKYERNVNGKTVHTSTLRNCTSRGTVMKRVRMSKNDTFRNKLKFQPA